jgi:hypothetical protein
METFQPQEEKNTSDEPSLGIGCQISKDGIRAACQKFIQETI